MTIAGGMVSNYGSLEDELVRMIREDQLRAESEGMTVEERIIEAGLRSRDWAMPEEVNRVVTDRIADHLLTPSRDGDENLLAEGIDPAKITFVGNIMIDTLFTHLEGARASGVHERVGVEPGEYAVLTLHRPSNVDDKPTFERILGALEEVGEAWLHHLEVKREGV